MSPWPPLARRLFRLPLLLALLVPAAARAATISWNNASGGNWTTASNWSPAVVPGAGDDVLITLAGTYSVTSASTVTVQSITIGAASGTQTLAGGVLTITGSVAPSAGTSSGVLSSCTLAGGGSLNVPSGAVLRMNSVASGIAVTNDGTLVLTGSGSVSGAYTSGAGSTLRVEANSTIGGASQTFANGFTNNGTLVQVCTGATFTSALTVTSGALVNAPGRLIDVQVGTGGGRTLTASLDNQGTLAVGTAYTVNKSAATHANSGTINVTGGDFTVTNGSGTFTNTGTIAITAGRTAVFNGGTFTHSSGTLSGGGLTFNSGAIANLNAPWTASALTLSGSTLNQPTGVTTSATTLTASNSTLNGPGTITNSSAVTTTLQTCTVNAPLANDGTLVLTGSGNVNGVYTSGAGSTLRVEANGTVGGSSQTFATGFTNNGTLVLVCTASTFTSTLAVTSGALVNAAGRLIDVQAGTGGGRLLTAALDNQGTLAVGTAFTINKFGATHTNSGTINVTGGDLTVTNGSGTFTNTGTIAITAGRTAVFNGGTFTHSSGTLSGGGLTFNSSTIANLNAPWTASALTLSGSTLNQPTGITTSSLVLTASNATLNGPGTITNSAAVTTTLQTCTVNASLVNDGTLVLTGSGNVNGGYTSGAGSTLRVEANGTVGGSSQTFATGFTNNGTLVLVCTASTFTSTLAVTSGTLVNAAGRLIDVQAGTGGARLLTAALANQGTLAVGTAFTISKSPSTHTNSGTINVTGGDLTVTNGSGTFTNTGTIAITAGRTAVFNGGTFTHSSGTLSGGGLTFNSSAIANLNAPWTASALTLSGSTLNQPTGVTTSATTLTASNSTLNGPGTITNSAAVTTTLQTCTVNAPLVNDGTLVLAGTGNVNGGYTSGAGSTLRVEANSTVGGSSQTFATGFTNNGTLVLVCTGSTFTSTLAVTSGALVNAAGRLIDVQAGTGGGRTLTAALDNQGTATVGTTLSLNKSAATHTNSGTINVTGGDLTIGNSGAGSFTNTGTITIGAGRTLTATGAPLTNAASGTVQGSGTLNVNAVAFTQAGSIRPGTSAGLLHVVGAFAPAPTAQLFLEVGGLTAGSQHDRLTSTLPMTFDGTLDLAVVNGFSPSAGQTFRVLAGAPTRTGQFAHITGTIDLGGGLSFLPTYTDSGLVLQVVSRTWVHQVPDGPAPLARDGHGAVLDPTTGHMIVFGGATASGVRNDVYVLRNADAATGTIPEWVALSPAGTPPAARTHAVTAYDPASNRLIVFGGDDGAVTPTVFADTWVLTNANGTGGTPAWLSLPASGAMTARTGAAAAYDAANKRLMVFGGSATGACGVASNDAWVLTNADGTGPAAWTLLAPTGTPPSARAFTRAGYDAAHNRLLLFSGLAPCGTQNVDTWALTQANGLGGAPAWVSLAPTGAAPVASALQAAAYEPTSDRFTIFGGLEGAAFGARLSTLGGASGFAATPTWVDAPASSTPPSARADASAVAGTNRVIVFGGLTAAGRSNEVFTVETDRGRVLDAPPVGGGPSPRTTGFARAAWPNPSRSSVQFSVDVAREQAVELVVCDVAGRRVATLHSGSLAAGTHAFTWDGRGAAGRPVSAGVYFVRLRAAGTEAVQRVLTLR